MKMPRAMHRRINRWAHKIMFGRRPDVCIPSPKDTYMRRWYVVPRNPILNVYLHEFVKDDEDRALHDHPWVSVSLLLDGAYYEHSVDAGGVKHMRLFAARDLIFRRARFAHRIQLADRRGGCCTLFITGPRLRRWGFHCTEAGWRPWQDFERRGCD